MLDGQKVWSSYAHVADFCILLARSDPDSQRHDGLTYVIVDMHAPGVEVRPLRQITGDAEFNEIFLTGVEVPRENLLGEIGGGWQVAMTTLLHERGTLGVALVSRLEVAVRKLLELARDRGATPVQRDAIAREWIELEALRLTAYRSLSALARTGIPGPEGSILKLQWSEANQRVTALALDILGPDAQLVGERAPVRGLVGAAAAPQPRQHDRGGHVRDPPQHRRRAGARAPEVALDSGRVVHTRAGRAPHPGARVPRRDARADLGAARGAGLDRASRCRRSWAAPGSASWSRPCCTRSSAERLTPGPFFSTVAVALPALPAEEQARVAAGETSWVLALGPFVPDLDTAERIAVAEGDGVFELVGAQRELFDTSDETRPLGMVVGGEIGAATRLQRRAPGDPPPLTRRARARGLRCRSARARARGRARLAAGAVRPPDRLVPGRRTPARHELHGARARALARRLGVVVRRHAVTREPIVAVAAAKAHASDAAVTACERAIQVHGGVGFTWEHVLQRLYKRALWIRSWEASGAELRAEVASVLLDGGE